MDINDVNSKKFFNKVTFQSDSNPERKLQIPDGEFCICAILLRLENSITKFRNKLR